MKIKTLIIMLSLASVLVACGQKNSGSQAGSSPQMSLSPDDKISAYKAGNLYLTLRSETLINNQKILVKIIGQDNQSLIEGHVNFKNGYALLELTKTRLTTGVKRVELFDGKRLIATSQIAVMISDSSKPSMYSIAINVPNFKSEKVSQTTSKSLQVVDGAQQPWGSSVSYALGGIGNLIPVSMPGLKTALGFAQIALGSIGLIPKPNPPQNLLPKIMDSLNTVQIEVLKMNAQLTAFNVTYNLNQANQQEKSLNIDIQFIADMATAYTNLINPSYNNSLATYIGQELPLVNGDLGKLGALQEIIGGKSAYSSIKAARDRISDPSYLKQLVDAIQLNDSNSLLTSLNSKNPNMPINYIAYHDQSNARVMNNYTQIVLALNQAYELNRLSLYLAADPENKYGGFYARNLVVSDTGFENTTSYSQKLARLDAIYQQAYANVESAFAPSKMINVYRDLPYFAKNNPEVSPRDFAKMYGMNYYDGKIVKGVQDFPEKKIPYQLNAADILELGKVRSYSNPPIYYYVNNAVQDIYTSTEQKVLGAGIPFDAAVLYPWKKGWTNIVLPVNAFKDAQIAENLYATPKFKKTKDTTWGNNFNTPVVTSPVGDFDDSADNISFNNVFWVRSDAEGANPLNNGGRYTNEYLFTLSALEVGDNSFGYQVDTFNNAYMIYRLSCATINCVKVPASGNLPAYLLYSDGYKIWINGDGSMNVYQGIRGGYTRIPSKTN